MRAKATEDFMDKEAKTLRKAGETFDVTEERFRAINATRYGTLAVEVKEAPKKPKAKSKSTEE